jgi:hypothetical protein
LKTIGDGGLRVVSEMPGANHQDSGGTLARRAFPPGFPTLHSLTVTSGTL